MNLLTSEITRLVTSGFAAVGMEMWILAFVLILILVGGKKIPELMRGVGKGVGELQKGLEEGKRGINVPVETPATPSVAAQPAPETEPRTETPKA